MTKTTPNDFFKLYMDEIISRVVAESGIPTDRYHLGKLILQSLKDAPDFIAQIDAGTRKTETNRSIFERSIRCAICLQNIGLKTGDVIVLMAPNHLDLVIPLYAALYLGVIVSPVDRTLKLMELQTSFANSQPKVIFCQSEKATDVQLALNKIELQCQIITFDKGDYLCSFSEFLVKYYEEKTKIENFVPTSFKADEAIACLIPTSGTTGLPKTIASMHKNITIAGPYVWARYSEFPTPTRSSLICSPLQWLTALVNMIICPILRVTRIQSSQPLTIDHLYYIINTYKPTFTILSPTMMTSLIKPGERDVCDFTNFELIFMGGSAVPIDLIKKVEEIATNAEVYIAFGMSELSSIAFHCVGSNKNGSVGQLIGSLQYRLIDIETQKDIIEPSFPGELWLKGPGIFKEYYRNPEATAEVFAEGHWFKTGDMFYRDDNGNFFFVERIKLLLKYKNYQISPVEVETVIRCHPAVLDVAVTGIPDQECGDLPVACVVLKPNCEASAQDIKDIVKDNLSDAKQLRGGVIFLDELPTTASTKIHRRKLKEIAMNEAKRSCKI